MHQLNKFRGVFHNQPVFGVKLQAGQKLFLFARGSFTVFNVNHAFLIRPVISFKLTTGQKNLTGHS